MVRTKSHDCKGMPTEMRIRFGLNLMGGVLRRKPIHAWCNENMLRTEFSNAMPLCKMVAVQDSRCQCASTKAGAQGWKSAHLDNARKSLSKFTVADMFSDVWNH